MVTYSNSSVPFSAQRKWSSDLYQEGDVFPLLKIYAFRLNHSLAVFKRTQSGEKIFDFSVATGSTFNG